MRVGGFDLPSVWNPSPSTFVRQQPDYGATSTAFAVLRRGRQSSPLAARGEAGRNAGMLSDFYTYSEL